MPPALDRLLASPSALRLLRAIVHNPEPPLQWSHPRRCRATVSSKRHYSTQNFQPGKQQWGRWREAAGNVVQKDRSRKTLENDETPIKRASLDIPHDQRPHGSSAYNTAAYWAQELARQERLRGKAGIVASWARRAAQDYTLPVEDTSEAEFLWGTYLKNRSLIPHIIEHATEIKKKTGKSYPRLYELVMSLWLSRHPPVALEAHRLMLSNLEPNTLSMEALAQCCKLSERPDAYAALMDIYRDSNEKHLYDNVVPALIELGELSIARRWHELCIAHNDLPSGEIASHPVVKVFHAEHSMLGVESSVDSVRAQQKARKYNRELLRRLAGRDTAPVRFEDSFTARMFATRTFPPESVIRGLAMVGVNELGPQAVYTMASRTEPLEELGRIFEELKENGIALQGSVFSLALEKFAQQENWHLVRSMLESDQHPDVFGDVNVQRDLLKYYIEQDDKPQIQRTLAILTLFHNDSTQESWNLLLQTRIEISGASHVQDLLRDMQIRGVAFTPKSIVAIRSLLRPRQAGRRPGRPTRGNLDDLRFVTVVYIIILESGLGAVPPRYWREIIRRFGMMGRLKELQRVLLWLLCWYAPRSSMQFSHLPMSPYLGEATKRLRAAYPEQNHYFHFNPRVTQLAEQAHPVRQLFPPEFIQSIIVWGFKAGLLPNAPHEQSLYGSTLAKKPYRRRLEQQGLLARQHWTAGLEFVVQLKNLGVYVHRHTVIKALQMQFINLFGRGRSRKKENRIMEDTNTETYSAYVREVNRIWGSPLFKEPSFFEHGSTHRLMWHPRARRQRDRQLSVSVQELLTPDRQRPPTDDVAAIDWLRKQFDAQSKAIHGPLGSSDETWKTAEVHRLDSQLLDF